MVDFFMCTTEYHVDTCSSKCVVLTGRLEQGAVKPGVEVVYLSTHALSNPCTCKVFTVEIHLQRVCRACSDDNVGLKSKGLDKNIMNVRVGEGFWNNFAHFPRDSELRS